MNRIFNAVAFASLCFSLVTVNSFASQNGNKGGGGGGGNNGGSGGGKPVQSNLFYSASLPPGTPSGTAAAGSDWPSFITITAVNHEGDAPKITMTSGPAGLIIYKLDSVDNAPGGNGTTVETFVWTPSRSDIGVSAQATFVIATQSGESDTLPITFEPVEDLLPWIVSGFTATKVGDHIEAHWNPNESGNSSTKNDPLFYTLTACYESIQVGSDIPAVHCDELDKPDSLSSLNIPLGPRPNTGNPSVPATYYGLFLSAWSGLDGHLLAQASANIQ
jgi:hypothetical protein